MLWADFKLSIIPTTSWSNSVGGDVVHPHCVIERGGPSFDLNAWRDGGRRHMHDLRGTIRLDSVGGSMLLVKADGHREGLIFPPFCYGARSRWIRDLRPLRGRIVGEIETEGLGIMAKDMGIECWGLPDLEVLHAKE